MNELQASTLSRYLEIHNHPTLKFISVDTSIQITRVFRILNGHEMKISEYEKFECSIARKLGGNNPQAMNIKRMADKCQQELSPRSIVEISDLMDRKLKIKSMI